MAGLSLLQCMHGQPESIKVDDGESDISVRVSSWQVKCSLHCQTTLFVISQILPTFPTFHTTNEIAC